jgi:hypothetical protein
MLQRLLLEALRCSLCRRMRERYFFEGLALHDVPHFDSIINASLQDWILFLGFHVLSDAVEEENHADRYQAVNDGPHEEA